MLRRIRVGRFSVDMPNVMTAHTEAKTFTNREGIEVTRNRAVLDDAEHAVDHALEPGRQRGRFHGHASRHRTGGDGSAVRP